MSSRSFHPSGEAPRVRRTKNAPGVLKDGEHNGEVRESRVRKTGCDGGIPINEGVRGLNRVHRCGGEQSRQRSPNCKHPEAGLCLKRPEGGAKSSGSFSSYPGCNGSPRRTSQSRATV